MLLGQKKAQFRVEMDTGEGKKDNNIVLQSVHDSLEYSNLKENYADELSGDEGVENVKSYVEMSLKCSK